MAGLEKPNLIQCVLLKNGGYQQLIVVGGHEGA
jgi:hypothetical protein